MATKDPKTQNKQDPPRERKDPVRRPGQTELDDTSKDLPGEAQPYNKEQPDNNWQHQENEKRKRPEINPREVPEVDDPNYEPEIEDPGTDGAPVEEKSPGAAKTGGRTESL